jgi:Fe(II)/alpha-ketoglutarate-dependent arginine beta-hydroxylase
MQHEHVPVREIGGTAAARLMTLARQLAIEYGTASNPHLVEQAPQLADTLDLEVREQCQVPERGSFVLRGLPVDDTEIGPTPSHWSKACPERTADWDIAMLLVASVMGRVFGWEGQQGGKLVHDIVPSPGQEQEQTGAGSSVLLSPHNEDAFHPERAHLLMLGCLRNPDRVATHAASVRSVELDETDRKVLAQPRLPILPDASYSTPQTGDKEAPEIPTLWQRADGICVRFDPAYTPLDRAEELYRAAYHRLEQGLQHATTSVRLTPGDLLVLDNDVVVHGRAPFQARYDGTDRWLKRMNVTVPGRMRPAQESDEHGYGQQTVNPYRNGGVENR